jgi:hypothetical protein
VVEEGNHYVASLVTTNLDDPEVLLEFNSSTSFEKALKWLFSTVSEHANKKLAGLRRSSRNEFS